MDSQVCWKIIEDDPVRAVHNFFAEGAVKWSLNSNFIALIPKVESPSHFHQFRPTFIYGIFEGELCHFFLKIISSSKNELDSP